MLFFVLLSFQSELGRGEGSAVPKSKIPKNLPSRKNATRRPHKQNMCRCAGRAFGAGARLLPRVSYVFCVFFAAKPQRSKITTVFSSFHASEAFWLPSGCVLGACAGCALAALWRRSGVRSPLPIARASLPAEPARPLPPGRRCCDLAPRRPARPASSQAARRQSSLGKTKSYTL